MVYSVSGRSKFLALILCLLVSILATFGCGKEEKPEEVIRSIKWTKVAETTARQVRMISGTTKPVDQTANSSNNKLRAWLLDLDRFMSQPGIIPNLLSLYILERSMQHLYHLMQGNTII